jgi:hypothetical protein
MGLGLGWVSLVMLDFVWLEWRSFCWGEMIQSGVKSLSTGFPAPTPHVCTQTFDLVL